MRFLSIKNWQRYQHYSTRRAPWIKAYTEIIELPLEHPNFTNLSDGAKLTLHHLRLLAGLTVNRIPETAISKDRLNMKTPPKVEELLAAGFVEWADLASGNASVLASGDASGNDIDDASETHCAPPRAGGRAHSQAVDLDLRVLTLGKESKSKASTIAGARDLVESFAITEALRSWAASEAIGVDVDVATESWRDHFRNTGYRTKTGPVRDADAAWRNWMRNELKFGRSVKAARSSSPAPVDAVASLAAGSHREPTDAANLDDIREELRRMHSLVRIAQAKARPWPLAECTEIEWSQFSAWRGDAIKSLEEWRATR